MRQARAAVRVTCSVRDNVRPRMRVRAERGTLMMGGNASRLPRRTFLRYRWRRRPMEDCVIAILIALRKHRSRD